MVEETIKEIKKAEAEADALIKEAESRCGMILKEASEKAMKLKTDILKEAQAAADIAMEEAKKQGVSSTKSTAADIEKNIKILKEAAARKSEEAVELVISKLI